MPKIVFLRSRFLFMMVVTVMFLSGCGGSGDGGGSGGASPTLSGVFVDSPVQGLPYNAAPSGLTGFTGPNGEFQYRAGDRMTFRIGNWPIGLDAPALPMLTPFTFLSSTTVPSTTDQAPVDVARLLLSLNTTPATERITLPATVPTLPPQPSWGSQTFDTDMRNAGITLVSSTDAINHLKAEFAIWGSWATVASPSTLQVFTFLPDGTYLLADNIDPLVHGGANGIERGTYRWSATTKVFIYTVTVNTDGTGGLSNPGPTQIPPYSFTIDQSGNNAVLSLGPNPSDQLQVTRVSDATNPIVGGWKALVPLDSGASAILSLLADGSFMVALDEVAPNPVGVERGTYSFDQATGNMTFTTTIDTNGVDGVNSSPTLPAVSVAQVQVTGDHMQFTQGTDIVDFDRVRVP